MENVEKNRSIGDERMGPPSCRKRRVKEENGDDG